MKLQQFSEPLPLSQAEVNDAFWKAKMELVRTEVIPYQWDALNDRVPGAAPSWCMHNFRAAARLMAAKHACAGQWEGPKYVFRGFEVKPEDPKKPDQDRFYGFVFQDTDFSKWVEAVAYSLVNHPDPELEKTADDAIDIVCAAQTDEGYLDTYYILSGMDQALTNLRNHHELYCFGHLAEGAVAYWQATGKDKLLRAACRFADYFDERFGPEENKLHGYPGHEIAEMALLRLYAATGEERYLRLGKYFIDQRGQEPNYFVAEEKGRAKTEREREEITADMFRYNQAHLPVRQQGEAVGHAVRAMYLYSGMADAARLSMDEDMLRACERLWASAVHEKRYITGGIGATKIGEAFSYPFDLPNDSAYSETCAAIGLVFFARRMLQIHPKAEYGDMMEQALYNTVLAGMALDGHSFFYVNPLEVNPEACRQDERLNSVKPVRQKWFGCACCPPNIARLVSSVHEYAYTASADTLYVHLYIAGKVKTSLNGGELQLQIDSNFPDDGRVAVSVRSGSADGTLAFRIPGWAKTYHAECEGKERHEEDGYLYLTGHWQTGDKAALDFPMEIRMLAADARVREDADQVAFVRGPVTFCAEEADNGGSLHLIRICAGEIARNLSGLHTEQLDLCGNRMTVLIVPAVRNQPEYTGNLYDDWKPVRGQTVQLKLIPYYAWANRGEGEMRVWLKIK